MNLLKRKVILCVLLIITIMLVAWEYALLSYISLSDLKMILGSNCIINTDKLRRTYVVLVRADDENLREKINSIKSMNQIHIGGITLLQNYDTIDGALKSQQQKEHFLFTNPNRTIRLFLTPTVNGHSLLVLNQTIGLQNLFPSKFLGGVRFTDLSQKEAGVSQKETAIGSVPSGSIQKQDHEAAPAGTVVGDIENEQAKDDSDSVAP